MSELIGMHHMTAQFPQFAGDKRLTTSKPAGQPGPNPPPLILLLLLNAVGYVVALATGLVDPLPGLVSGSEESTPRWLMGRPDRRCPPARPPRRRASPCSPARSRSPPPPSTATSAPPASAAARSRSSSASPPPPCSSGSRRRRRWSLRRRWGSGAG